MSSSRGSSIITYIIVAGQLNHNLRHRRGSYRALKGQLNRTPRQRRGVMNSKTKFSALKGQLNQRPRQRRGVMNSKTIFGALKGQLNYNPRHLSGALNSKTNMNAQIPFLISSKKKLFQQYSPKTERARCLWHRARSKAIEWFA